MRRGSTSWRRARVWTRPPFTRLKVRPSRRGTGADDRPEYDALDLAAREGDGDAAAELARRFRSGQGVPVNDARAYAYASVAAARGDMIARMERDMLARAVGRGLVAPAAIEAGAALASDVWGQAPARP